MITPFKYLFLLFLCLFFATDLLVAEIIILDDENVIQGKITRYSSKTVIIETKSGTEEIELSKIRLIDYLGSLQQYRQVDSSENTFTILLSTRLRL